MSRFNLANLPTRVVAGAFILNSGINKWGGDEETATRTHGMAAGAYPFLESVEPTRFLKWLAGAELALGASLLTPLVPRGLAGAGLTGFAAGLLGMYARTPGMHDGTLRPTPQGTAIAKDVWLLGIGAALVVDALTGREGTVDGESA